MAVLSSTVAHQPKPYVYHPRPTRVPGEPAALHGEVYEHFADGRTTLLAAPGATVPDLPSSGAPTIPDEAVKDGRVVIYVDGIQESEAAQCTKIANLLQAPASPDSFGCDVGQPVIAIHEGVGRTVVSDLGRITYDLLQLKRSQTSLGRPEAQLQAVAKHDPAVKAIHDEIRQSLEAGREVTLVSHSGGGCETALALTLLEHEEGGRFKQSIADHVRLLELSPAASSRDFILAGVKPENLYHTGSRKDPLWQFASHYVNPCNPFANLMVAVGGAESLYHLATNYHGPYHDPNYIFWKNVDPSGMQPIQAFLDGGPGGEHPLD
jgi:hypothetical protein